MQSEITVVAADDHPLVLAGVKATLSEPFRLVATVANGTAAWEACETHRPHLLLLDVDMPGFTTEEILTRMEAAGGYAKIVILTAREDVGFFHRVKTRVHGYLLKDEIGEELLYALRAIHLGAVWYTQKLALEPRQTAPQDVLLLELTDREREVLAYVAHGMSNSIIGNHLSLAEQTIRNYVSTVYDKLGLQSRAEAVVWARERNLLETVPPPPASQADERPPKPTPPRYRRP